MRLCVLGHRGMLGHVVARCLAGNGAEVVTVNERFSSENAASFVNAILALKPDWCVNCIGVRPDQAASREQLFLINSKLPEALSSRLRDSTRFIQASTDGVFRPGQPNRAVTDQPDASEDYGLSKRQAESSVLSKGGSVIRCSVIGPEVQSNRSLLSWFLSRKDPVRGFTNQAWNGITTLVWAEICQAIIAGKVVTPARIIQPGFLPPVSKHELLLLIAREWNQAPAVSPCEAENAVLRTLLPNFQTPPIDQQLRDLRRWY